MTWLKSLDTLDMLKLVDFQKHEIEVEKYYDDKQISYITANKFDITHAIMNVVSNAIESYDKTVSERIVSIDVDDNDDSVVILVKDNGVGIAPNNMPSVFDPFFTTKGSRAEGSHNGFGMGLSITQKLLSENNGTISIDSALGKGSEVKIVFDK